MIGPQLIVETLKLTTSVLRPRGRKPGSGLWVDNYPPAAPPRHRGHTQKKRRHLRFDLGRNQREELHFVVEYTAYRPSFIN